MVYCLIRKKVKEQNDDIKWIPLSKECKIFFFHSMMALITIASQRHQQTHKQYWACVAHSRWRFSVSRMWTWIFHISI
jgi:hypothetical protein